MKKLMRLPALKALLGLAEATIYDHMKKGLLPRPFQIGPRAVAWPGDEIDAIIEKRRQNYTDEQIKQFVAQLVAARAATRPAPQKHYPDRRKKHPAQPCDPMESETGL